MKNRVVVIGFLVVSILVFSNGACQGDTSGGSGSDQLGDYHNFGFGVGASAGGNHAPRAHHLRGFYGPGWGQGPPPGPPPMFGGGFGPGFGPSFGPGFNFTSLGTGFNFTGFGPSFNSTGFSPSPNYNAPPPRNQTF